MKIGVCMAILLTIPGLGCATGSARQDLNKVLTSRPDLRHGEQLFTQCAGCHGNDGGGEVSGSTPRIAGQHYAVLVRQIVDFRHGKRWDFRMEGIAAEHNVLPNLQDIADVSFFVSQLDRDGSRGIGDGLYVERGEVIYQAQCVSCHGRNGEGDNRKAIPRISGQHAAYLARQIYDAVDGRRLPLTESHAARFRPLDFEEVLGLTDYLSRIGWQGAEPARPSP